MSTFKLKPYPTLKKSNESFRIALFFLIFAFLNFLMVAQEGGIALVFALLFTFSGVRHLSRGIKLRRLPEKSRAYRIKEDRLIKVLGNVAMAELPYVHLKALWLNKEDDEIFLMSAQGVESLKRADLLHDHEWLDFTQTLERSFARKIWNEDQNRWQDIQQKSQWMQAIYQKETPITKFLIYMIVLGCAATLFAMFNWMEQIAVLGLPQLVYIDLGAYIPWLPMNEIHHYTNYVLAPFLNYNLLQAGLAILTLHILGRWIEKLLGSKVVLMIYFGALLSSMVVYSYFAKAMIIGSSVSSLALIGVASALINQKKTPLPMVFLQKLSVLVWLMIGHLIFFMNDDFQYAEYITHFSSFIIFYLIFRQYTVNRDSQKTKDSRAFQLRTIFIIFYCFAIIIKGMFWFNHSDEARLKKFVHLVPQEEKLLLEIAYRCSQGIHCDTDTARTIYQRIQPLVEEHPLTYESKTQKTERLLNQLNTYFMIRFEDMRAKIDMLQEYALIQPKDLYGSVLAYLWQEFPPQVKQSLQVDHKASDMILTLDHIQIQLSVDHQKLKWRLSNLTDHIEDEATTARAESHQKIIWFTLNQDSKLTQVIALKLYDQPLSDRDSKALKEGFLYLGETNNYDQIQWVDIQSAAIGMREVPQIFHWKQQARTQVLIEQLKQL